MYIPYSQRAWTPYGFPPLERTLIPTITGLRKQQFQMDFFDEGTIPGNYISPGENLGWSPNQLQIWQEQQNALAGDPAWKHKSIALPPGSKVFPMKPIEIADQADEVIMTQVCMGYDVEPMELGVSPKVSATQSTGAAHQMAKASQDKQQRKSTRPTLSFLTDIFNVLIQVIWKQDDMRFVFEGLEEDEDFNSLVDRLVQMISFGLAPIDECRIALGKPPYGLPITSDPVFVSATAGLVPLGSIDPTTGKPMGTPPPAAVGGPPPGPGGLPGPGGSPPALPPGAGPPGAPKPPGSPGQAPPGKPAPGKPGDPPVGPTDAFGKPLKPGDPGTDPQHPAPPPKVHPDDKVGQARQAATEAHAGIQQQMHEDFAAGKPLEPPVRPPTSEDTNAPPPSTKAMLAELDALRRMVKKGRRVEDWRSDHLPDLIVEHFGDLCKVLAPDDAYQVTRQFTIQCFGPPVIQAELEKVLSTAAPIDSSDGKQGLAPMPPPGVPVCDCGHPHAQGTKCPDCPCKHGEEIDANLTKDYEGEKPVQQSYRDNGAVADPPSLGKAGGAGPKVPGQGTRDWPVWKYDLQLKALYAKRLQDELGALPVTDVVGAWLASQTQKAAPLSNLAQQAWAWLTSQGFAKQVRDVIQRILTDLWTEGFAVGRESGREAISSAYDSDFWDNWKPGDVGAARLAAGPGLQQLLQDYGIPTIKSVSDTRMHDLANALAEGFEDGDSADTIATSIEQILTVPQRAQMIAGTELARAVTQSSVAEYRKAAYDGKRWSGTPDDRICPRCKANVEQGMIPLDQPFASGDTFTPGHPECRCAILPDRLPVAESGLFEMPSGVMKAVADEYTSSGLTWIDLAKDFPKLILPDYVPMRNKVGPHGYSHGWVKADPGAELAESVKSGVAKEVEHKASHTVRETTFGNGQTWFHKGADKNTKDAEVLASKVSGVLGTHAPSVVAKGGRVYTPKVDGKTGSKHLGLDDFSVAHTDREAKARPYAESEQGKRIGLQDLITGNTDRTDSNWMVGPHDQPVPIDHSRARYNRKPLESEGRFGSSLKKTGSSWSRDQWTAWRQGLTALQPDYAKAGRQAWYDSMMAEFDKQMAAGLSANKMAEPKEDEPLSTDGYVAGGLAVRAKDTGRVLMIQRAHSDDDPAAGMWEFPGGRPEPGETVLDAARREWAEETGLDIPDGKITATWDQGKYRGHVLGVPSESSVPILSRAEGQNPDDPDGEEPEAIAWWDPSELKDNPVIRPELQAHPKRVRHALEDSTGDKISKAAPATDVGARVYQQLLENYPPDSIAWVKRATWTGPEDVPWAEIDHDDMDKWAASHQPERVEHFMAKIRGGDDVNPAVLVNDPDGNKIDVDGHHRALAYHRLGKPVRSWIGTIDPADRHAMEETHLDQVHEGASPANKSWSNAWINELRGAHGEWTAGGAEQMVTDSHGQRHWGAYGGAGMLVRHHGKDGETRYLLQQRPEGVQLAGTFSTPGGALHRNEPPEIGAHREAEEEWGKLPELNHQRTLTDDHGGWAYHTVIADARHRFRPRGGGSTAGEAGRYGWYTSHEVDRLPLHPGFAATWDKVRPGGPRGPALRGDEAFKKVTRPDNLSADEKRALAVYGVSSGYRTINPYLHHDGQVFDTSIMKYRPATDEEANLADNVISSLDSAFSKVEPLDHAIIVHRGTGDVESMFGPVGSKVGKKFISKSYTSTTTVGNAQVGFGYGYETKPGRLEITVPPGSRVLMGNDFEHEAILPRDAYFLITSDTPGPGNTRNIRLEYVPR
jgi:SPP1 gp7 family putative phage head morphogenesis protein